MKVNFDYITDTSIRKYIINGFNIISELGLWTYLKNYETDYYEYIFYEDHKIKAIDLKLLNYSGPLNHSEYFFGHIMRFLDYIAKYNLDKFKKKYIIYERMLKYYKDISFNNKFFDFYEVLENQNLLDNIKNFDINDENHYNKLKCIMCNNTLFLNKEFINNIILKLKFYLINYN